MPVSQVNGTNTGTTTDPGTSLTITKPTSMSVGDVMTAGVTSNNETVTAPSGWVRFGGQVSGTDAWQVNLYYKVVTASEPSSYTWTVGSVGPSAGFINCWSGVDTSDPIVGLQEVINDSNLSEPHTGPSLNVSPDALGRLYYIRACREASGSGTIDVTTGTTGVSRRASVTGLSASGNTGYAIGHFSSDSNYNGVATYPGIDTSVSRSENNNYEATYALKSAATPASGGFTVNAGHVTVSGAGNAHDDGTLAVQLGHATLDFNGTHFPPGEGVLDFQLSPVGMQFEAEGVGGPMAVQLQHVSVDLSGGLIHGGFSMELSKVEPVEFTGSVNPIGGFSAQLGNVTMQFVGETRPFGAQVIFIEPEKRGLRISQDDTTPIYASEVTQE